MGRGYIHTVLLVIVFLVLITLGTFFFRKKTNELIPIYKPTPEDATFNIKVLTIGFNPQENGQTLADTYFKTQMLGMTSGEAEDLAFSNTVDSFKRISQRHINFEIVKKIHITDFPEYPDGFRYTLQSYSRCVSGYPNSDLASCEERKGKLDYVKWLTDLNICQLAKEAGAHEVWILSPPFILAWENFMFGPNLGFTVNGPAFTVMGCDRHYIVVNGTYDQLGNILHNFSHRIESTMKYLSSTWRKKDRENYIENFMALGLYQGLKLDKPYCGNGHHPSNTPVAYEYDNKTFAQSNCLGWQNFPNFKEEYESINCEEWGCRDEGWQEYWFSQLPNSAGEIEMISQTGKRFRLKRNWWYYILFPENSIEAKESM